MAQETMHIALPDNLKEYVLRQVADGGYTSASEYVRELIRFDQKRKAQEKLDSLLMAGLESGEAREFTAEGWAKLETPGLAARSGRRPEATLGPGADGVLPSSVRAWPPSHRDV